MQNQELFLEYSVLIDRFATEYNDPYMRDYIRLMYQNRNKKIIVLDDDPTGVQTVHGVYVLTRWDKQLIREAFRRKDHIFFILTNSRAFPASEAERINREIAKSVYEVAKEEQVEFDFISRSDSTLRGHYPLEIDILSEARTKECGMPYDGHLLVPAFFEAGRYTVDNIHYLKEKERLVPMHLTEFSKDKVFGYTSGELSQWIEEKTEGRFKSIDCLILSIDAIRQGPDVVGNILMQASNNMPIIVNALSYADLDVVSCALMRVEARGKKFIYRTSASFVKSYSGISDKEYLSNHSMISVGSKHRGGIIVVGSHVRKTTEQLDVMLSETDTAPIEMNVEAILDENRRADEIASVAGKINEWIENGRNAVIYSSRTVIGGSDKESSLNIGQKVSSALVSVVQSIRIAPKFIIAKGGITASDVATMGLGIVQAKVLGQAAPGVPVWLTGKESRFPGTPYIIFPGNVGNERTLAELVLKL